MKLHDELEVSPFPRRRLAPPGTAALCVADSLGLACHTALGLSTSSSASAGAQLGDVDSGGPVMVIGGGKSNVLLWVALAGAGLLVWLLFFRRRQ